MKINKKALILAITIFLVIIVSFNGKVFANVNHTMDTKTF